MSNHLFWYDKLDKHSFQNLYIKNTENKELNRSLRPLRWRDEGLALMSAADNIL